MNRFIRSTLAALVVATAGIAASAPSANAGGIGFELSIGGPGGGIVVRDLDRRGSRDHDRRGGRDGFGGYRDVCRPDIAVGKARDMGVRRADVVRAGDRRVVVEGFRHHRPVRVVFANERNCPVIGFRR
ncbi:hypothetical protein [Hoeflea sp. EC-HK425]|uniref:hypothetical protein n=1 Tax=Hoeflea sp. EC-HK425 TaxID=2038388 RepID=UPI00125AE2B9|nr:hypothetical protein [Hoeflea sp. EC-HK425]VVT04878.1 conserved exported hypothetical protein [Hoeflea sp. EC-HK425]|tara:strand:+ start:340 stop:726 length:387 start_codon:yes stop_codon:yes gene_type:complete